MYLRRALSGLGSTSHKIRAHLRPLSAAATAPSSELVLVDVDSDGVAQVTLHRPEKINALNMGMFEAISSTITNLQTDRSLRAVVLSGQGRGFCSGLDVQSIARNSPLKSMERLLERPDDEVANLAQHVCHGWRQLPVPVVCAIHGVCFGGGLQIALGADIRLATPDARLSIMEVKWGLIPDMGASVVLRELVRIDVAKELTMTGKIINGEEAASYGLVTRCVQDPLEEAKAVAKEISQRSPDAVALAKKLYQDTWVNASEKDSLQLETNLQRKSLKSWNQMAATGRSFGFSVPYFNRE